MRKILASPELNLAFFSFTLHFVWELLQVPTYAGMAELKHWDGVLICAQATLGDVGFALLAFWVTAIVARSRRWPLDPDRVQVLLYLSVGLMLTMGFEFYYTQISFRWSYSQLMPLVPPFGTGLSPLVQWIVVPLLVLHIVGKQIR